MGHVPWRIRHAPALAPASLGLKPLQASSRPRDESCAAFFGSCGERAGEGNRTLVCSLGSCRSTIELRPRINDRDGIRIARWLPLGQAVVAATVILYRDHDCNPATRFNTAGHETEREAAENSGAPAQLHQPP